MAVKAYFVTAYFGGKTYLANGVALISTEGKRQRIVTVASWCGGPDFIVEEWPTNTAGDWRHGDALPDVSDELFTEADEVLKRSSLSTKASEARLNKLLGPKLVARIHDDVF